MRFQDRGNRGRHCDRIRIEWFPCRLIFGAPGQAGLHEIHWMAVLMFEEYVITHPFSKRLTRGRFVGDTVGKAASGFSLSARESKLALS